jgi:hypothetical protein
MARQLSPPRQNYTTIGIYKHRKQPEEVLEVYYVGHPKTTDTTDTTDEMGNYKPSRYRRFNIAVALAVVYRATRERAVPPSCISDTVAQGF